MKSVIAERPGNFNRVMLPAEKKILEEMLEQALGVARKKKTAAAPARAKRKPRG